MIELKAGDVLTVDKPVVNPQAVLDVQDYLRIWRSVKLSPDTDPPWEGGWEKVNENGKITKRIGAWLYKEFGLKLEGYELSTIGTYAANAIVPAGTKIEVTDNLDWDPGDYQDHDSCFFKSRRQTWAYLHHMRARAAKFHIPGRMPGRCLILNESEGALVAFNFYGLTFKEGGAIIQAALGRDVPVTESIFTIGGSTDMPVYINHSSCQLIGRELRPGEKKVRREEDMRYVGDHNDQQLYCENCYDLLAEAPYYSYAEDKPYNSYVCQGCFEKLRDSTRKRWQMAHLIPVPVKGKSKKKKKPAIDSETLQTIEMLRGVPIYSFAANTITIRREGAGDLWVGHIMRMLPNVIPDGQPLCTCAYCLAEYARIARQWIISGQGMTAIDACATVEDVAISFLDALRRKGYPA